MSKQQCYCSFCAKSDREVEIMLAGPACAFICDECVAAAVATVAEKKAAIELERKIMAEARACAGCIPEPIHG